MISSSRDGRSAIALLLLAFATVFLISAFFQNHSIGTCITSGYFAPPRIISWFDQSTIIFWGWGGLIFGQLGWFANITAMSLASGALHNLPPKQSILVLHSVFVINSALPIPLAHNEGYKEMMCLASYGTGYYCWAIAMALIALAGHFRVRTY